METMAEENLQQTLDNLMRRLTSKQRAFLNARKNTTTDVDAANKAGVHGSTASRWKSDVPFFKEAYDLVLGAKQPSSLEISTERMLDIQQQQIEAIEDVLPEVVKEHISLALYAESESVRLSAIKEIYNVLGIENKREAQNKIKGKGTWVELVQILAPQIVSNNEEEIDRADKKKAITAEYLDLG